MKSLNFCFYSSKIIATFYGEIFSLTLSYRDAPCCLSLDLRGFNDCFHLRSSCSNSRGLRAEIYSGSKLKSRSTAYMNLSFKILIKHSLMMMTEFHTYCLVSLAALDLTIFFKNLFLSTINTL